MLIKSLVFRKFAVPDMPGEKQYQLTENGIFDVHAVLGKWLIENKFAISIDEDNNQDDKDDLKAVTKNGKVLWSKNK